MARHVRQWRQFLLIILLFSSVVSASNTNVSQFVQLYGQFLKAYWHPAVVIHKIQTTAFNYKRMKLDAQKSDSLFSRIIKTLKLVQPNKIINPDQAKAFWINVYNFAAMRLIIKYYPVQSIRDFKISLIRHPWSRKVIDVGGHWYSLKEIEKDILLRRYADPRIVFAVSCAAISCPDQLSQPFTAQYINQQLNEQIRQFLRNPSKGFKIDKRHDILSLSWIFKKDQNLFGGTQQGVIQFILPYLTIDERQWLNQTRSIKIHYLHHDWTLNDLALVKNKK